MRTLLLKSLFARPVTIGAPAPGEAASRKSAVPLNNGFDIY